MQFRKQANRNLARPQVVNGCSDLMVLAFGDKGRHARSAVGVPSLPMNVAVEVRERARDEESRRRREQASE